MLFYNGHLKRKLGLKFYAFFIFFPNTKNCQIKIPSSKN